MKTKYQKFETIAIVSLIRTKREKATQKERKTVWKFFFIPLTRGKKKKSIIDCGGKTGTLTGSCRKIMYVMFN